MKSKPLISPKAMTRMLQSASELWQQGEHAKYFDAMDRASRMDPRNYQIPLDVGAAHLARYNYPEAQEHFERSVSVAPDKSNALEMIGLQCRNLNRYDLAERYFERAAEQKGATADTLTKLAEMYERLRRLD